MTTQFATHSKGLGQSIIRSTCHLELDGRSSFITNLFKTGEEQVFKYW